MPVNNAVGAAKQPALPTSQVRLGLIYSANSRKAFAYLQENFEIMKSAWASPNTAPELDPRRVRRVIGKLLGNRFGQVLEVQSLADAETRGLDLAVILDIKVVTAGMSFSSDTMDLTAIFVEPGGKELTRIAVQGETRVAYPARIVFGSTSNKAFGQFQQQLDNSTKLAQFSAGQPKTPQIAYRPTDPPNPEKVGPMKVERRAEDSSFPQTPAVLKFPAGRARSDDIAVIIGNANYRKFGGDIPNVQPAYADAAGFRLYALQALGIRPGNIIDLRDATSARLVEIFGSAQSFRGQLYDWVQPGRSRVYIYYSGHGAPGTDRKAYLVPVDANAQRLKLSGYPLDQLYRNLRKLPATEITVVLEACFSGLSQSGAVVTKASPVFIKTTPQRIPKKVTAISAGAANQIASWEQDGSHSLFTKYFLQAMSGEADKPPYGNGNGKVSNQELAKYLKRTMTYFARRYYGRDQKAQIISGR